ncbi:hypothetical protein AB0M46_16225 [Dactylosporangium sp. NPDC051485]|uniref:hypothetical protein n=1 Tax=Dactylosporangium sp. NPDC051485 TaxID=3154846 RepID=UPI00343D963E
MAEGFELPYQVADFVAGVDAGGVVVGAEVAEPGGGVGQEVPDDDEDGAGDGDEGFEFAAAFDDASVAFAEEGAVFGGCGGFAEGPSWSSGLVVGGAAAGIAAISLPRARPVGTRGSRSPRISASIMSRAERVSTLLATDDTLISESSRSFSSRCQCRVRSVRIRV